MTIKTIVLNHYYANGSHVVTYRYWIDGDCECSAVKIKRTFKAKPSEKELLKAI